MGLGQVQVDGVHHLLGGVRACDGQHTGVHLAHHIVAICIRLGAQAAGDDHAAVLRQRLANRVQAFAHRVVNKAAGVDDDQVRALEGFGGLVALGAELGEDELGIGQRFGAAQADKAHLGCGFGRN